MGDLLGDLLDDGLLSPPVGLPHHAAQHAFGEDQLPQCDASLQLGSEQEYLRRDYKISRSIEQLSQ